MECNIRAQFISYQILEHKQWNARKNSAHTKTPSTNVPFVYYFSIFIIWFVCLDERVALLCGRQLFWPFAFRCTEMNEESNKQQHLLTRY